MWQQFEGSDWMSIQFEGMDLPPCLMGISILVSLADLTERAGDWIWRLSHCRGVEKSGEADWCHSSAQEIADYLIENRAAVLEMIEDRLGEHGFAADRTFVEWLESLVKIVKISASKEGMCSWMAKEVNADPRIQLERMKRFFDSLEP